MEIGIAFLLFGAVIGMIAARQRGFSLAGGFFGGLLLGFAAPLLYLVFGEGEKCAAVPQLESE